jgi:hypothetical protein
MSTLTNEEQHEGRNAVLCLKDLIRQLRKSKQISDQNGELAMIWIKKIDKIFTECNKDVKNTQ